MHKSGSSPSRRRRRHLFDVVCEVGLALPGVEVKTKYDGSPMLTVGGSFMAGLATHRSAEPETLVVRCDVEDRERLIEDAPASYYLTDYYRSYPLVLVRLSSIDRDALADLLAVSRRLTLPKIKRTIADSSHQRPRTARVGRGKSPKF